MKQKTPSSQDLPTRFTIRVYGILVQDGKVLLSEEEIDGYRFTKFPGGGLEPGEGPPECLQREFTEETGLDIVVAEHLYTTDRYIRSQFVPEEQVIGIYYMVEAKDKKKARQLHTHSSEQPFGETTNQVKLKWQELENLRPEDLTFELDQAAAGALLERLKKK